MMLLNPHGFLQKGNQNNDTISERAIFKETEINLIDGLGIKYN